MRVFRVDEVNYQAPQDGCSGCTRKIRPGQWVMHCMVLDGSYIKRNMLAHVDCVRALLEGVPDLRGAKAQATRKELVRLRADL